MDEQLRRATRAAAGDPGELARAAAELARAGDRIGASRLLHARLDEAGPALELLEPPPVGTTRFSVRTLPLGDVRLGGLAWAADELALWAVEHVGVATVRVVRLSSDGAPAPLAGFEPPVVEGMRRLPYAPAGPLRVQSFGALALSPDAERLALVGHVHGGAGVVWFVLDLARGSFTQGPVVPFETGDGLGLAWWGPNVVGHGSGLALCWSPGGACRELGRATTCAVADGTVVGRLKRELLFLRPDAAATQQPVARCPYPLGKLPKGWDGVVAASGGRVLIVDQEEHELHLLDATDELARRDLPPGRVRKPGMGRPGNLVAVRPCPSGRVVALRYMQLPLVVLLDLRDGSHVDVPLDSWPEDPMVWSPSGQTLAVKTKTALALISAT